uniref:SET domain-containing protein n=1 Tax=Asterionellopsis glacialis TaxID=33640 RepID=A0A7S0KYB2_9STRA|mmetsp:Transcript_2182/g.3164  ORF Transcript_2182/g.3164 Transcript_2182/m.3164 type:complete len:147 (+) Transcript_2182:90-530(+)
MASHPDTLIDCSKVYVKKSNFSNVETGDFDGAFAAVAFKKGDLIEKGLMRRLPEGFDGNTCPYIFTWSTERPNKTWAMGSGCAPYYNTDKEGQANTKMVRFFDEDKFEIYAERDIEKDEELLHTYISLKWRTCFSELNDIVNADEK